MGKRDFTTSQMLEIKTTAYACAFAVLKRAQPTPEEMRMEKSMTTHELAQAANVSTRLLRRLERGEGGELKTRHFELLRRIANALGVPDSQYNAAVARQREKNRDSARLAHAERSAIGTQGIIAPAIPRDAHPSTHQPAAPSN
jgi:transcriptional regulator with XRE-family HTH domain